MSRRIGLIIWYNTVHPMRTGGIPTTAEDNLRLEAFSEWRHS